MKRFQLLALSFVICQLSFCPIEAQQRIDVKLGDAEKPAVMHVFPIAADSINSHTAIVLCPGGGYSRLSMSNEGYDWVPFFHSLGITPIVLEYRMPHGDPTIPVCDAEKAMRTARERSAEWNVNPRKVGIMGFSAGGHLASTITVSKDSIVRPDFSVLFYPVVSMCEDYMHRRSHNELLGEDASEEMNWRYSAERHVTEQTPPVFLALSNDDRTVLPLNSTRFYEAMLANNRPCSLHIYPTGRHGWGFRDTFLYHEQMKAELIQWLHQY